MFRFWGQASGSAADAAVSPDVEINTLDSGKSESNTTVYTTGTFQPAGNSLVLLAVASKSVSSGDNVVPTVTGNGLTWVEVDNEIPQANYTRLTVFRAMGSSPTSGQATITFSATQDSILWDIQEFANVDTSGTNGSGAIVQTVSNTATATSVTVTLAAFGATDNATYGAFSRKN